MIPYTITNKLTGELLTATDWTSSTGEGQNFLSFNVGEQVIKFNRPEHQVDENHLDNGEYTAVFVDKTETDVNTIPVVETTTETA